MEWRPRALFGLSVTLAVAFKSSMKSCAAKRSSSECESASTMPAPALSENLSALTFICRGCGMTCTFGVGAGVWARATIETRAIVNRMLSGRKKVPVRLCRISRDEGPVLLLVYRLGRTDEFLPEIIREYNWGTRLRRSM